MALVLTFPISATSALPTELVLHERRSTTGQGSAKKVRLPDWLNPYGGAVERYIHLVTRGTPHSIAHRFWNHDLPFGTHTISHTLKYNSSIPQYGFRPRRAPALKLIWVVGDYL